jgi:hypothetical protein
MQQQPMAPGFVTATVQMQAQLSGCFIQTFRGPPCLQSNVLKEWTASMKAYDCFTLRCSLLCFAALALCKIAHAVGSFRVCMLGDLSTALVTYS